MLSQPPNTVASVSANLSTCQPTRARNFLHLLANPEEPKIDIVAVHGLNPLGRKLHAEATWTAAGNLWLRDFLPLELPGARIALFDYNANVAFHSSTAGVLEQSQILLNRLELSREVNSELPIIFICHSLGGILVKRALISAKQSKVYKNIVDHTFGVVFFGTPHRGGNNARAGDLLARIVRRIRGRPKNSFMSALQEKSFFASTITNDFRQFFEVLQFQSYYETQPMRYFGIIVDPKAAVLGLPDTREKSIALDADHSSMCKFASKDDPVYQQVEENIVRMVNDAIKHFGRSSSTDRRAPPSREAIYLALSRIVARQFLEGGYDIEDEDHDPGTTSQQGTNCAEQT